MFRRPADSPPREVVRGKHFNPAHSAKLGITTGKDFVRGSEQTHADFYGDQTVQNAAASSSSSAPLTDAEKNKIHAKILKAEMKGDKELVKKLKKKLQSGHSDAGHDTKPGSSKQVMLLKHDRSGNIAPLSRREIEEKHGDSRKRSDIRDLVRRERMMTADDEQRELNEAHLKSTRRKRRDDDDTFDAIDDNEEASNEKRARKLEKKREKDERKAESRTLTTGARLQNILETCEHCLESDHFRKYCVIAIGIKTHIAVAEWEGLSTEHILIVPNEHFCSSLQLDEDVYDEMRLWLASMIQREDEDCVFMETVHNIKRNPHCYIEAIPISRELSETVPMCFHKEINDSESEWSDNKKLIKVTDIRRQVPKGFEYFHVDFGLDNGFAHVIEDLGKFRPSFGHEILAGLLDLPPKSWKTRANLPIDVARERCNALKAKWEPFDWTRRIER